VVGTQCKEEAFTFMASRLHSTLERSHRAARFCEPLSKLDFEPCDLLRHERDPRNDVTRQQAHSKLVRVLKNGRVIDCQAKR